MSTDLNDFDRRFGGLARLYGPEGLRALQAAHVMVIGIGGVGSWAAEALARSGVGQLTLVDLDHVALSNTNRQIHALDGNFGKSKVEAMAERIRAIQPGIRLQLIDDFIEPDNLESIVCAPLDCVIDAIDQMRIKTLLAAHCRQLKLHLVVSGSAGGKVDPTRIRVADLSQVIQDPLLSKMRARLRKEHQFARTKKMGVQCVYSEEPVKHPTPTEGAACDSGNLGQAGLACTGYGSAVTVTASFGLFAAARAIDRILSRTS